MLSLVDALFSSLGGIVFLRILFEKLFSLLLLALLPSETALLHLVSACLGLVTAQQKSHNFGYGTMNFFHLRQLFGAQILCLLLVDIFCQNSLVLEHISFDLQVQPMIPENRDHR